MQQLTAKIRNSDYLFPLVFMAIGAWRITVPQLPANQGLGWDGYSYYQVAVDGFFTHSLNTLLAFRLFPSLFIHAVLSIAHIALTPPNIILAFKIMNTLLIGISALLVKRIFNLYKLDFTSQLLGFTLVFLNYGVLNFTYYYPVMTDTPAFTLSIAMLYFFLYGQMLNVLLCALIGAFTWPIIFPMGVALILFPQSKNKFVPLNKNLGYGISAICVAYALIAGWFYIVYKGETPDMAYTLPFNRGMFPASTVCVALLFFFMPYVLFNHTFFSLKYYKDQLNGNRIFAMIAVVVITLIFRNTMEVKTESGYFSTYMILKNHYYAFLRPMLTVVNHFNYFGCVMLVILLFWKRFAAFVSTFGLGVSGSLFFNFIVLAMLPESRTLMHLFAWLSVFAALYLGQYRFSKWFYAIIIALNFAASKIWLFFDYSNSGHLRPDGTIDFPEQWFYMHLGVWITEPVWFWLLIITTICIGLLILTAYKINFGKKALLFYPKFAPINYGRTE